MAAGNNSDQRLVCRQIEIQNILRLPAAFNPTTNAMLTTSPMDERQSSECPTTAVGVRLASAGESQLDRRQLPPSNGRRKVPERARVRLNRGIDRSAVGMSGTAVALARKAAFDRERHQRAKHAYHMAPQDVRRHDQF